MKSFLTQKHAGGRPVDKQLHGRWTYKEPKPSQGKGERAICNNCTHDMARHSTKQQIHLDQCAPYLAWKAEDDASRGILKQSTISRRSTDSMSKEEQRTHDLRFAYAVYMSATPFTVFDTEHWRAAFCGLRQAFKPPTRKRLANDLLDEQYNLTRAKVLPHYEREEYVNFVTDASDNIIKDKVVNLCLNTYTFGGIYLKSEVMEGSEFKKGGEAQAKWLVEQMRDVLHGNLQRVNSIQTDTENTQMDVWHRLAREPATEHIFAVGCDAHGLQLLFRDLVMQTSMKKVYEDCKQVVKHFSRSHKHSSLLRAIVKDAGYKQRTLVVPGWTRWGTTTAMFKRMKQFRIALQDVVARMDVPRGPHDTDKIPTEIATVIHNADFWTGLTDLLPVLQPIFEAQKCAEADSHRISYVLDNWAAIYVKLLEAEVTHPRWRGLVDLFKKRASRQITDLHFMAYFTRPNNHDKRSIMWFTEDVCNNRILATMKRYSVNAEEAWPCFDDFRAQRACFTTDLYVWQLINRAPEFWNALKGSTIDKRFQRLVYRLAITPANSTDSERSFSVLNLTQTKLRNQLAPERVDKLQYVYINERGLLRQVADKSRKRPYSQISGGTREDYVLQHLKKDAEYEARLREIERLEAMTQGDEDVDSEDEDGVSGAPPSWEQIQQWTSI